MQGHCIVNNEQSKITKESQDLPHCPIPARNGRSACNLKKFILVKLQYNILRVILQTTLN